MISCDLCLGMEGRIVFIQWIFEGDAFMGELPERWWGDVREGLGRDFEDCTNLYVYLRPRCDCVQLQQL